MHAVLQIKPFRNKLFHCCCWMPAAHHILAWLKKKSTQSTLPLLILLCDVPNGTSGTEKVPIRCVGVALDNKAYIFRLKHIFVIILPPCVVKKAFYVYYYGTLNADLLKQNV